MYNDFLNTTTINNSDKFFLFLQYFLPNKIGNFDINEVIHEMIEKYKNHILLHINEINIDFNQILNSLKNSGIIDKNKTLLDILGIDILSKLNDKSNKNNIKITEENLQNNINNFIILLNLIGYLSINNIQFTNSIDNLHNKNTNNNIDTNINNKLLTQIKTLISKIKQLKSLIKLLKYVKAIITYKGKLNVFIKSINNNNINKIENKNDKNNKDKNKNKKETKNNRELSAEEIKKKVIDLRNTGKDLNSILIDKNNKQQKQENLRKTNKTETTKNNQQQIYHKDSKENNKTINKQINNIIQKIVNTQVKAENVKGEMEELKKIREGENKEVESNDDELDFFEDLNSNKDNNTKMKAFIETTENNLDNTETKNILTDLKSINNELENGKEEISKTDKKSRINYN